MNALDWLNSEAFTAFGQHIIWSDMIGNTIGLIALVCVAVTVALRRHTSPLVVDGGQQEERGALSQLADPTVARLVAGFVLLSAANNAAISATTLLVTDRLGLDPLWGGVALATAAGLEIPALLALGRLSTRIDTRRRFLGGELERA